MSLTELKSRIHEEVENIDDEQFLLDLKSAIDKRWIPFEETEIVLTEAQLKALDEADAQIDRGEFLTNQQMNDMIDEWLKK